MEGANNPTRPPLAVTLTQTNNAPVTIAATVTNQHTSALTFLKWSTPIDALALELGLFSLTPAGSELPLNLPTIQVKRVVPPPQDQFVTLEPGESAMRELMLKGPIVSTAELRGQPESGGKSTAVSRGMWMAVWAGRAGDICEERLESLTGDPEFSELLFESNVLELTVD
jgi:hypothetical protein